MVVTGVPPISRPRKGGARADALRIVPPVTVNFPKMALIPTAWGLCGVVWKNRDDETKASFAEKPPTAALCKILTPGLPVNRLREVILKEFPACQEVMGITHGGEVTFHPETVPEWFNELLRYLQQYYTAGLREWTVPQFKANWAFWKPRLDWEQLTPFQRQVLEVVACISCGCHLSYGEVAKQIGKKSASRAVGAAVGANPWPVLIPCHRVLGTTGKLTGFSAPGGVETKRRMLEMERGPGLFR